MDIQAKINQNKKNLWKAIEDYKAHTFQTSILDNISKTFVERLAESNAYAKSELRNLFRKSPAWKEGLDAIVINGTRTHDPNYNRIFALASEILEPAQQNADFGKAGQIDRAIHLFASPHRDPADAISAIRALTPKAYAPNKKPSRIFRSLCNALGVSDETAGSRFQQLYAQFADELSAKKIGFKLFVSLNPAHFLTMSNPKCDSRGNMLTSCHSLNSTEYPYNCGCAGYARDGYSFIAFIAADPDNPETLNNRKTMRQMFAYKPGNGLLLQSRLYNTEGGTYGAQKDSKLYRDLVQREISALEDAPNLWQTYTYFGNSHALAIDIGKGFGGYADWVYEKFDAKISIRNDHTTDYAPFSIGTYGLCIQCGCEIDRNLYCNDCNEDYEDESDDSLTCDHCDEECDETYPVHTREGNVIYVCEECRDNYYDYCRECGEYHPREGMIHLATGGRVCRGCAETHYSVCRDCGRNFRREELADGLCPECRANTGEKEALSA